MAQILNAADGQKNETMNLIDAHPIIRENKGKTLREIHNILVRKFTEFGELPILIEVDRILREERSVSIKEFNQVLDEVHESKTVKEQISQAREDDVVRQALFRTGHWEES